MRTSSTGMIAARSSHNLESRNFVAITGRNRSTGETSTAYFWDGIGTVEAEVFDLDTGSAETKTFVGVGSLISIEAISYVCEQQITVRNLSITLSQINEAVASIVRGYDLHEQACNVYQGDFDLTTGLQVAPAESVWSGFVDTCEITDPAAGDMGSIVVSVRSHQTEMTRTNTAKRSHAAEIVRNSSDTFYQDVSTVADWITWWGEKYPASMKARATIYKQVATEGDLGALLNRGKW